MFGWVPGRLGLGQKALPLGNGFGSARLDSLTGADLYAQIALGTAVRAAPGRLVYSRDALALPETAVRDQVRSFEASQRVGDQIDRHVL